MIIMAISSNYWQLLSQRASGKNNNGFGKRPHQLPGPGIAFRGCPIAMDTDDVIRRG